MNAVIKSTILTLFHSFNIHPSRMTDAALVRDLIIKLRPVTSGKALVRLGPEGDGGYLVPDDFDGVKACFSPGVDKVSGFESDCADMGMNVFMADASVDAPPESNALFKFTKKYVGVTTNDEFMTLDDWVLSSMASEQDELLLQIDIEGFEYEVFMSASNQLMTRFRIIAVEFHGLDQLWNRTFFSMASRVFDKLLQTHSCVHNHPNNTCGTVKRGGLDIPLVTELTFLRNDRIESPVPIKTFPHPLDCDNSKATSLPLPRCWYE